MKSFYCNGFFCAISGATLFAFMGTLLEVAHEREIFSSTSGSLIRIFINTMILFLPLTIFANEDTSRKLLRFSPQKLLWLWGALGAATLLSYYFAIPIIGISQASFLQATQGVFIALLAPLFLREKNSKLTWIAIFGCFFGAALLFNPNIDSANLWGKLAAIISGLCAALAYLTLAKIRAHVSVREVSLYWCLGGFLLHAVLFLFGNIAWPQFWITWILLIGAGVLASLGQVLTTLAYQKTPATQVAAVAYLTPVISMSTDMILFRHLPNTRSCLGASLILVFGVLLPFLRQPKPNAIFSYGGMRGVLRDNH